MALMGFTAGLITLLVGIVEFVILILEVMAIFRIRNATERTAELMENIRIWLEMNK